MNSAEELLIVLNDELKIIESKIANRLRSELKIKKDKIKALEKAIKVFGKEKNNG